MCGPLRVIALIETGIGIRVLPNDRLHRIVASGAIYVGMLLVLYGSASAVRIMSIDALRPRIVRAMTTRALPALVCR